MDKALSQRIYDFLQDTAVSTVQASNEVTVQNWVVVVDLIEGAINDLKRVQGMLLKDPEVMAEVEASLEEDT